jgi:UDPglucose--hexose-1-phosphate uridylyltransferase
VSERRWNPVLGEWVITATHRQDRTFLPPAEYCPLDATQPGDETPTEIERPDFEIAVFENRFPSLRRDPPEPSVEGTDLTPVEPAIGACEVIVYTPEHNATLAGASVELIRRLVGVWAHRTLELGERPEIRYVFPFENKGEQIGVTLHHPHGQIYAYPEIPTIPLRETRNAEAYEAEHGECLWCSLLRQELADGRRIVAETATWIASVPFFAHWPYEVHLTPRRHVGWLHELDGGEAEDLARILKAVLVKYDALFGFSLPYIMAIHQRPTEDGHDPYHLHVEFYPPNRTEKKLKYLAGSEAGAGAFINDTLQEETAARLRELEPRDPAGIAG